MRTRKRRVNREDSPPLGIDPSADNEVHVPTIRILGIFDGLPQERPLPVAQMRVCKIVPNANDD